MSSDLPAITASRSRATARTNRGFNVRSLPLLLIACLLLLLSACGGSPSTPPPQPPPPTPPPPTVHLQTFTTTLSGISFTMVGADPTKPAAGSTSIPVVIVPIRLNFSNPATTLSPENPACNDTVAALTRFSNSPIFQNQNWTSDTGLSGNTQFGDAYQRANFSKYTSTVSPDYHVLLAPITVLPSATYTAPPGSIVEPNPSCPGRSIGGIPISFMDSIFRDQVASNHITPDILLILLTYDIKFLRTNGGFFLGYHNNDGSQTYIAVSYADPNFSATPGLSTSDVAVASHEIAEWLDNPFLTNVISPAWGDLNTPPNCDDRIEVGDPLDGYNYPVTTPSFPYHIQEIVYFSWFARDTPSIASNGRYSTLGTLTAPAAPCR